MVRAAAADSNGSNLLKDMMSVLPLNHPARTYYKNVEVASEKTFSSILVSVQAKLGKFDSNGMLAAADELDLGDDHDGIIEIDPEIANFKRIFSRNLKKLLSHYGKKEDFEEEDDDD